MDSIIRITNLEKSFKDNKVLHNINLTIRKSERLAILGSSGAGKTTLLRIISSLEKPTNGEVIINSQKISYVFQEPRLIPWRTVEENLLFVNGEANLIEILELIKLTPYKNYYPHQLSGGMKQRVNLARALITKPDLLILDEAFSSLDLPIKLEIINDLATHWQEQQFTMIIVTHDPKEALFLADRIVILADKPAMIKQDLFIKLDNENRKISNPNLLKIEADILHLLSNLN